MEEDRFKRMGFMLGNTLAMMMIVRIVMIVIVMRMSVVLRNTTADREKLEKETKLRKKLDIARSRSDRQDFSRKEQASWQI